MKEAASAEQISAIFLAIRQTNFSDSMTHGPRINTGRFPPIVTLPILNGLDFNRANVTADYADITVFQVFFLLATSA